MVVLIAAVVGTVAAVGGTVVAVHATLVLVLAVQDSKDYSPTIIRGFI